jgi:hypothetical protein
MKTIAQEWIRYAAVSACALTIDVTVFYIFGDYPSWCYVAAATTNTGRLAVASFGVLSHAASSVLSNAARVEYQ